MAKDNEAYEAYNKAFSELFENYPFIAEDSSVFIPVQEYLDYFRRRSGQHFLFFSPSAVYDLKILERLKDKLVYTSFLAPPSGGRQLVSLFQLSPEAHVAGTFMYNPDNGGFYLATDLYVTDGKMFLDFMRENKEFIRQQEKKQTFLGFGAPASMGK